MCPRTRRRVSVLLPVIACVSVGYGVGCALVLGFDETTLKANAPVDGADASDAKISEGGRPPDAAFEAGVSRLSVDPAAIIIRRGSAANLTIKLDRQGLSGPLTPKLTGLPSGVTAASGVIADGASTTKL